jgi:hypothetical protein
MRMRLVMVALGLALLCAAPARAATITLQLSQDTATGLTGLSVGIVDVVDLFAYAFNINFSSPVSSLEVVEGDFLSRGGNTSSCLGCFGDETSLLIASNLVAPGVDPIPGVSGAGELIFLRFLLSDPNTTITLSDISLSNSAQPFGEPILLTDENPSVTAAPIPEPSTIMLMGIGLAGLARRKWRARAGAAVAGPVN